MHHTSKVTQKWQITIPVALRKSLGIRIGDAIEFESKRTEGRAVIKVKKSHNIMDLAGILPKPAKALSVEEMSAIIQKRS